MQITDAQVHIWPPESPRRQWPAGTRAYAHGDSLSAEQLLTLMDEAGVDRAVLVPPSWEGDRNDFCAAASRQYPERLTVAGRVPLEQPVGAAELRDRCAAAGLRGIRCTFARGPARALLVDGTAEWLWREAERAGIPVFLYPPDGLPAVADIARRYPSLRIVIDHLGIQTDLRDAEIDPVIDELLRLAPMENVAVKATSLPSYVTEPYPFPSLRSRVERVVSAFGPRRVFWGSDVTRLPVPYRDCVRLFTEALDFLTGSDLEWVMGRALGDWIGWPARVTHAR